MKDSILTSLKKYKEELTKLKKEITKLKTKTVSRNEIRSSAELLASQWIENLRSPLEHKYKISKTIIDSTSESIKMLHILSRPNNLKSSYTRCLNQLLKEFDNNFILPIQSNSDDVHGIPQLQIILEDIPNVEETEYLSEAISCAQAKFYKAAVVMGWCAVINHIQKKFILIGFDKFNETSRKIKNQNTGKFKRWNKEFNYSTLSEMQTVFDTDLIVILEGMNLIDSNQAQRLETCFQYRNHSAHPGEAPIEPAHVVSFFIDIKKIIFNNTNLTI